MENKKELINDTKTFNENPYDPLSKKPEDIVRLFYTYNVPIVPVVSKRGMLLGILREEDVTSEMSDIERIEKLKIDKFIAKLAKKMTLDDLLFYAKKKDSHRKEHQKEFFKIKEFTVINLFGEVQGTWSRLQLFTACEAPESLTKPDQEIEEHTEEQVLEWIIYLILEHIPRPLYAINSKGKTIFYNSLFEDTYTHILKQEIDPVFVEKSLKNSDKNELMSKASGEDSELFFYNKDLQLYYEKIPLISKNKKIGFLIFLEKDRNKTEMSIPGINIQNLSLADAMDAIERKIIVDSLNANSDISETAQKLKLTRKSLQAKLEKHGIKLPGPGKNK